MKAKKQTMRRWREGRDGGFRRGWGRERGRWAGGGMTRARMEKDGDLVFAASQTSDPETRLDRDKVVAPI